MPAFGYDPPLPTIDPDNKDYWDAAARGELTYSDCNDCNKPFFYPRRFCIFCLGDNVKLSKASGKGEIYAVTVVRKPGPTYALAFVRLAEGPTVFTSIVECDYDSLKVSQPVEVVFEQNETGNHIPKFKPV
jgi:uncharacterized protein